MFNLSPNAKLLADACFEHYNSDTERPKHFDDFSKFDFSNEELLDYCKELENAGLVLIEYYGNDQMYLYALPNLVSYGKNTAPLTSGPIF